MSREQVLAAKKFANVLISIVPLLSIRPEWEIRFQMGHPDGALRMKFIFVHEGRAFVVEHAIAQRRHLEPLEICRMAEGILSSTDAKFTAAIANYDQENPAIDLTPDDS